MKKHIIVNQAGPYHLQKGLLCQDSVYVKYVGTDIVIAAVADGLGSEKHSDIGSKIASKVAVEHIADNYSSTMTFDKVKALMNNSFVYAYKAILEKVEEMNEDSDEFDTTLCLAILDGKHLFFGQSGDSGMIALLEDGAYINCAEPQNDEEGYVWPLCSGPKIWEFGEIDEPVCSVMLMTDGIYKRVANGLIQYDERVYKGHRIEVNVPLAEKLMRRSEKTEEEIIELSDAVNEFFFNYPKEKIDDDKSLVLIFDPELVIEKMPDEYYQPLDFNALHQKAVNSFKNSLGYTLDNDTQENNGTKRESNCNNVTDDLNTSVDSRSATDTLSPKVENPESFESCVDSDPTSSVAATADSSTKANNNTKSKSSPNPIHNTNHIYPKKPSENGHNYKCSQGSSVNIKKKTWVYDIAVLAVLLFFGTFAFFASDYIRKYATASYVCIFLISFFSNSTVLLPAPSSLVVIEYSLILNPFLVALCGGLGAAVGEMTGF